MIFGVLGTNSLKTMKIKILSITSKKNTIFDDVFFQYQKRLPTHIILEHTKIAMVKRKKNKSIKAAITEEEEALLKHVNSLDAFIVLDETGKQLNSNQCASSMNDWMLNGQNPVFAIGGPDGFSKAIKDKASTILSLSMMTLPHAMVPVMLSEQLYRSWTILDGQPYHRN